MGDDETAGALCACRPSHCASAALLCRGFSCRAFAVLSWLLCRCAVVCDAVYVAAAVLWRGVLCVVCRCAVVLRVPWCCAWCDAVCVPTVVLWRVVLRGVTRCCGGYVAVTVVLPWRLCLPFHCWSAYVRSPSMVVPFVTVSFGSCDVCGTIGDCRDSRWRE